MEKADFFNLPQRMAEKYGTGEPIILSGLRSYSHQAFEIHEGGRFIGYISWGFGDV